MESLPFYKMHGGGNDFAIFMRDLDTFIYKIKDFSEFYNPKTGLSFDQCLFLDTTKKIPFFQIVNADGSHAKQCLNGARCIGYLLHFIGTKSEKSFQIENETGVIDVTLHDDDQVEISLPQCRFTEDGLVDVGNLHKIIETDILVLNHSDDLDMNVSFVEPELPSAFSIRTFERGVGETQSCGSAAAAAAFYLDREYGLSWPVDVNFKTVCLKILKNDAGFSIIGPAKMVFSGQLYV